MSARAVAVLFLVAGCDDILDLSKVTRPFPDASVDAEAVDAPANIDPCAPTAVPAGPIRFAGTMLDSSNNNPIVGLSVDLTPGGVATTDSTGAFAIDSGATTTPLIASLATSGVASFPAHGIFYQRPFTTTPADVSNKLLSNTSLISLYSGAGVALDKSAATALVAVRDCLGNGVAGATVSATGAKIVYQGGGASTNGTGVAYALSIPPGPVEIDSTASAPFTASAAADTMLLVYLIAPP